MRIVLPDMGHKRLVAGDPSRFIPEAFREIIRSKIDYDCLRLPEGEVPMTGCVHGKRAIIDLAYGIVRPHSAPGPCDAGIVRVKVPSGHRTVTHGGVFRLKRKVLVLVLRFISVSTADRIPNHFNSAMLHRRRCEYLSSGGQLKAKELRRAKEAFRALDYVQRMTSVCLPTKQAINNMMGEADSLGFCIWSGEYEGDRTGRR